MFRYLFIPKKMKKIISILLLMISVSVLRADQLQVLSLIEAEEVVDYFKSKQIDEVIIYYSDGNPYLYVKSVDLEIVKREGGNERYEIHLSGLDKEGHTLKKKIDLAYLYIKQTSTKAVCLGTVLNFDFSPLISHFNWDEAVASSRLVGSENLAEIESNESENAVKKEQAIVDDSNTDYKSNDKLYFILLAAGTGILYLVKYLIKKNKKDKISNI